MVMSHAVSRGCLAALVGRRFLRDGLCVYFAGIRSLFAFILLTYNYYVLYWYRVGLHLALYGRLVLFFDHPKNLIKKLKTNQGNFG